jgi:subtilase family serine protease
VFAVQNRDALAKLQTEQHDPASTNYRHWLTPNEFNARFGPNPSDFKAASDWLSQQGFTIIESNLAARYIRFRGTVGLIESTFGPGLVSTGDDLFVNTQDPQIPARFQNVIAAIGGLDNMHASMALKKKSLLTESSEAQPTETEDLRLALSMDAAAAESDAIAVQPETKYGGFTAFAPSDLRTFYDITPILNSGISGTGDCIAIVGDSNYLSSAVSLFNTTFGMPTETVNTVLSSHASGTFTNPGINRDVSEALLDIEWSHAAAPGATINFYLGDDSNTVNGSINDGIQKAVNDNACSVISVSFGLCGASASFYTTIFDPIAAQADAQGQSIFIAAGDWGAAGLIYSGGQCVAGTSRNVNEMSADPHVTSVGGSSFSPTYNASGNDTSTVSDTTRVVWNTSGGGASGGATGGGASAIFSKPNYQQGLTPSDSARDVPDISMISGAPGVFLGDDQSGAVIDCCWGGTSVATPVLAGITKLIEQRVGQRLGNINTRLYRLASTGRASVGIRDITSGNNTFNSVTGFTAGPGYDQATGWGEIDANQFMIAFTTPSLVWQNTSTGERAVWFMNGINFLSSDMFATVPTQWQICATADLSNDGHLDLIWQNTTTGERAVWVTDGLNLISAEVFATVPTEWQIAGVGDFNGDGYPDLIWQNTETGDRAVWFMNSTSVIGAEVFATVPTQWQIAAVADFNGDGHPDLIWQNTETGERAVWFMNGISLSSAEVFATIPTQWQIVRAGDFNGDGHPDLIWQNTETGERAVWFMNGISITSSEVFAIVPTAWQIAQ